MISVWYTEFIERIILLTKAIAIQGLFTDDIYLWLDSSHYLCENLLICERIHMFQQENFSLNPPRGCKVQPRYTSLGYPFHNMAAHT